MSTSLSLDMFRWIDSIEMNAILGSSKSLGGLELSNGCCVLHVPSYLEGLYAACQSIGPIDWVVTNNLEGLKKHDIIIWAGGAGMFQDGSLNQDLLPFHLVRGQSLVMNVPDGIPREAALCGKYISPMLDDRMLVGASHEFSEEPMSEETLYNELKEQTYDFAPGIWDMATVERLTCGWRVQSRRSGYGRLPIVGRLCHNQFVYTGLSSRGLLYHGVYAEKLRLMILCPRAAETLTVDHPHLNWWQHNHMY